jgi:hypothetical protein
MATESLFNESTRDIATIPVPRFTDTGSEPAGAVGLMGHPKLPWILRQVQKAEPKCNKWRTDGRECQRFIAGRQLSDEDERVLKEQRRPHNAFNTTQKFIRYISGVQRDSYLALLFNAVSMDNDQAQLFGDRVQKYFEWATKMSHANNKRSRAFNDFLITGMGWTKCFISRAKDPRGLVGYDRIDPMEMLWPDGCAEINLDAEHCRWRAREAWIENEEIKALFPSKDAHFLIDYASAEGKALSWPSVDRVPYKIPYVQSYPLDKLKANSVGKKDQSRMLEFEWWDNQAGYVFEDPLDNTEQFMNEAEFSEYKTRIGNLFDLEVEHFDRQIGRHFQHAFILNRRFLMEEPEHLAGSRFTFNPVCCHFDEESKLAYGFAKVMLDPNRYINKFFNQMLESFAKQAKGGYLAEVTAFDDKAQLQDFIDTASMTGSINVVGDGAIQNKKIIPKQQPEVPAAAMAIMQFVISAMGDTITGINAETLGLGGSGTSGVTLKRKQRAGMVLLAAEFDAEEDWRQEEGMIVYDHLQLISDSRLIRVGGPASQEGEVIKLEDAPFSLEYEISLDEAERDPNMKQYLADLLLGPFGQTLLRMNKFLPMFVRALPIPRTWAMAIEKAMTDEAQQMAKLREAGLPVPGGRGQQKGPIQIQAEVAEKNARAELEMAKAKRLSGQSGTDMLKLIMDGLTKSREEKRAQGQHGMDQGQHAMDMATQATDIWDTMRQPVDKGGGGKDQ